MKKFWIWNNGRFIINIDTIQSIIVTNQTDDENFASVNFRYGDVTIITREEYNRLLSYIQSVENEA